MKEGRPAYSILVCPDSGLLLDTAAELLKKHPPGSGAWERTVFWGDEPPSAKFWSSLNQAGLFASNMVILVRQAHLWAAEIWKNLLGRILPPRENVWPIFCLEVEYEKGKFKIPSAIQKSDCLEYAARKKLIWTGQRLAGASLKKYAEKCAREAGVSFSQNALEIFCAAVTPEAAAIANEVKRLAGLASGNVIGPELIETRATAADGDAFLLINQLEKGNMPEVLKVLESNAGGSLLFYFTTLMARELRILWQLFLGEKPWLPPAEAPLKHACSKRLGYEGIASGLSLVAETEWRVKSGRLSPEQAMNFLIHGLFRLFNGERKA